MYMIHTRKTGRYWGIIIIIMACGWVGWVGSGGGSVQFPPRCQSGGITPARPPPASAALYICSLMNSCQGHGAVRQTPPTGRDAVRYICARHPVSRSHHVPREVMRVRWRNNSSNGRTRNCRRRQHTCARKASSLGGNETNCPATARVPWLIASAGSALAQTTEFAGADGQTNAHLSTCGMQALLLLYTVCSAPASRDPRPVPPTPGSAVRGSRTGGQRATGRGWCACSYQVVGISKTFIICKNDIVFKW